MSRKCHTLLSWSQPKDRLILVPDALHEMEQIVHIIQQNIKSSQDRQNIYANKKRRHKEFNIGAHVYIRVKPKKSTLRTGSCPKLPPCYCGPFEILDRIRPIAYQLALPSHIKVHNVFHVSLLNKYVHDFTDIIH